MFLFGDSCDLYSATADLLKRWASNTNTAAITFNATGGRNGGGCISLAASGAGVLTSPNFGVAGAGAAGKIAAKGFWFKCASAPSAQITLQTISSTSTVFFNILILATGVVRFTNVGNGIAATGTKNICDGQWHWIELRLDGTTSTWGMRLVIDGISDFNTTIAGQAVPANLGIATFVSSTAQTATMFIDDYVIYDEETGPTGDLNASTSFPLGPQQFTTKQAQADGTVTFATVTGGGTHFNQVNEVSADGDTTYVESPNSGDQDLYDIAAMGISPANIKTVIGNVYIKNPNPGTVNFAQVAKSGSTTTAGTSTVAPAAYNTMQQSFPQDPNTSAAWASASAIDSATFGMKVV